MLLNSIITIAAKLEILAARALVAMVLLLIVVNIVTRYIGMPVYWIDELAIYAMIWMVFICLPVLVNSRKNITVDIVTDLFGSKGESVFRLMSDLIVFITSAMVFYFSLNWFDVFNLAQADFDLEVFSINTFNYIYYEPTNTLSFNKYMVWIIVPVSFFLCVLHSGANLMGSLLYFFEKRRK